MQHTKPFSRAMTKHDIPNPNVQNFLSRMQALNALWFTPNEVRRFFPSTETLPLPPYVDSGCEACMLAVIGGRPDILFDLRASLISRSRTSGKEPRLLRFVDAYLEACEHMDVLRNTSSSLGEEVKDVRKRLRAQHKEKTKTMREKNTRAITQEKKYGKFSSKNGSVEKMRFRARGPASVEPVSAAERTAQARRNDYSLSMESLSSRLGHRSTSPIFPPPTDVSADPSPRPVPANRTYEPVSPVSPISSSSVYVDEYSSGKRSFAHEHEPVSPMSHVSAEFTDARLRQDEYMPWSPEDEAKRLQDLFNK